MYDPAEHPRDHVFGKRTGPKPLFLAEDLLDAAVDVGLDDFTFTSIARKLGVSTPSLYRIVRTKDDVARLCFRLMSQRMDMPSTWDLGENPGWRDALNYFREQFYDALLSNTGAAIVSYSIPMPQAVFQDYFYELAELLKELGMPGSEEEIDFLLDTLFHTLVAHVAADHYFAHPKKKISGAEDPTHVLRMEAGEHPRRGMFDIPDPEHSHARMVTAWDYLLDAWERGVRPHPPE